MIESHVSGTSFGISLMYRMDWVKMKNSLAKSAVVRGDMKDIQCGAKVLWRSKGFKEEDQTWIHQPSTEPQTHPAAG